MAKRKTDDKLYVSIDDEKAPLSEGERTFVFMLRVFAPDLLKSVVREFQFARSEGRKWRMDFAWIEQKVYVEIDGGAWTYGRHSRGLGIEQDAEKENFAASLGWRRLRFTPQMCERDPDGCVAILRKTLGG